MLDYVFYTYLEDGKTMKTNTRYIIATQHDTIKRLFKELLRMKELAELKEKEGEK